MKSKAISSIPLPVRAGLKKLGRDISDARKRRRISTAMMAERARISRPTLVRLERGDANVSLGIFATVLFILGMHDAWLNWRMPVMIARALDLEAEALPKRIDSPRRKRVTTGISQ